MIGWQARPSPAPASRGKVAAGRGMAYVHYKNSETYVAVAMEVEVDRGSGEIAVRRVCCAHDCGLMINPDAVRAQVEGNILQTLSRTLYEETTFDRSRVTSVDWASYRLLRFPAVPRLEIALIDRPRPAAARRRRGRGEPGAGGARQRGVRRHRRAPAQTCRSAPAS